MGGISVLSKNADYLASDSNDERRTSKTCYTVSFEVVCYVPICNFFGLNVI